MTLAQAKETVFEREKLAHKDDMKIFYPDPVNENDCAQCGKHKDLHIQDNGKPFFCGMAKKKSREELMDEAAELYIKSILEGLPSDEEIKNNIYPSIGGLYGEDCGESFIRGAKWIRSKIQNSFLK